MTLRQRLTCPFSRAVHAWHDGAGAEPGLTEHLARCPSCSALLAQLRALDEALLESLEPPPAALAGRIQQAWQATVPASSGLVPAPPKVRIHPAAWAGALFAVVCSALAFEWLPAPETWVDLASGELVLGLSELAGRTSAWASSVLSAPPGWGLPIGKLLSESVRSFFASISAWLPALGPSGGAWLSETQLALTPLVLLAAGWMMPGPLRPLPAVSWRRYS